MRDRTAAELGPFAFAARDLPPMEVRLFRWWEDELVAIKALEAEDDEEAAPGKGRAPKKRSISDLFAAAPPVDPSGSSGAAPAGEDDEEVLGAILRRTKEQRRRRRLEAEAAAATVTATALTVEAETEPSSTGETRDREANSTRQVWSSPAHLDPAQSLGPLFASMMRFVCFFSTDFLVSVFPAWIDLRILHHYDLD